MHITVAKDQLTHILSLANTVIERKNTNQVLSNVNLVADQNSLIVYAADSEVSVRGNFEAQVKTPGAVAVDAKVLFEIVRELPGVEVTLVKKQRVEIESGQARFKVACVSSDEYPSLNGLELTDPVSVDAAKFCEMFEKTSFAVCQDDSRRGINGVYVEMIEGDSSSPQGRTTLRFVATDGHRLAVIDRPAEGFRVDRSVIIPRKGIQAIKKSLEGNEGAAKVALGEGFFTVESGNVRLGARLVDASYPNYRQAIPTEHTSEIEVGREDLLAAVRRVALVSGERDAVRWKLISGTLLFSCHSAEFGEGNDSLEVKQQGEDVTIGFSSHYMVEMLNAMSNSEVVNIKLNGPNGPGLFQGSSDELYNCVIMPMRFD